MNEARGSGDKQGSRSKQGHDESGQASEETPGWLKDNGQADANASIAATGRYVREYNHKRQSTAKTYELSGEASAGATALGHDAETSGERTGTMTINRAGKGDRLLRIEFTQKTKVNGELRMIRTKLPIENEQQYQTAERWLAAHNEPAKTLELTWNDMAPSGGPGPEANDFERLLYREAKVTRADYASSSDETAYGGEVLRIGGNYHRSESQQSLESADYLGAPRDGRRGYRDFVRCHG